MKSSLTYNSPSCKGISTPVFGIAPLPDGFTFVMKYDLFNLPPQQEIEIWKDIKESNDIYQISSKGRFKRKSKLTTSGRVLLPVILKESIDGWGYPQIVILWNGKPTTKKIHRLLALYFIPNPLDLPQIIHIDGNKLNYSLSNLEWCTQSENMIHSYKNNLHKKRVGEDMWSSRYKKELILEVRQLFTEGVLNQREIAKKVGLGYKYVNDIIHRKTWKHI